MSGERLLGSYIVRVSVREGRPRIAVLNVGSGSTIMLESFSELSVHLEHSGTNNPPPDLPPESRQGGKE